MCVCECVCTFLWVLVCACVHICLFMCVCGQTVWYTWPTTFCRAPLSFVRICHHWHDVWGISHWSGPPGSLQPLQPVWAWEHFRYLTHTQMHFLSQMHTYWWYAHLYVYMHSCVCVCVSQHVRDSFCVPWMACVCQPAMASRTARTALTKETVVSALLFSGTCVCVCWWVGVGVCEGKGTYVCKSVRGWMWVWNCNSTARPHTHTKKHVFSDYFSGICQADFAQAVQEVTFVLIQQFNVCSVQMIQA